jgi:hypothetical protein
MKAQMPEKDPKQELYDLQQRIRDSIKGVRRGDRFPSKRAVTHHQGLDLQKLTQER